MASLAASLLFPLVADAGSYTVTYSGGTITASGQPVNDPPPTFSAGGGDYGAAADVSAGSGGAAASGSCSVNIQGPITATFTWTHDNDTQTDDTDPPPTAAIVEQDCNVGWVTTNAYNGGTGTGSADSGLPENVSSPAGPSGGSDNTDYSVGAGGASFHASCGAKAMFTGSVGGVPYQGVSGTASVSYHAHATPVAVQLSGYTVDPNDSTSWKYLTGQPIGAGLNVNDPNSSTYSVVANSYQWSASGDTFCTYNEKASSHQLVLLSDDPSYTNQPGFSCYDKSADSVTVTCKATILFPDHTTAPVTATSKSVTVLKPTVTHWGYSEGYVQPKVTGNGQTYGLYQDPSTSYEAGMTWHDVAVSVPAPFAGGQCDFGQLVEPDREEYHGSTSKPINNDPNNGLIGLDGALPYSTDGYGSGWTPPAIGGNGDSPQLIANGNPNNDTQLSANDTFTTWIIYKPTGGVWVPLQKYSWTWSVQLSWSSNQWNITAAFPKTAGAGPNYTPQDTNDPPQWTLVH